MRLLVYNNKSHTEQNIYMDGEKTCVCVCVCLVLGKNCDFQNSAVLLNSLKYDPREIFPTLPCWEIE
jgi:hypothetical protein